MSARRLKNFWTMGHLHQRGWSNALIRELLPQPVRINMDGRVMRCWSRDDVRAAERDPRFSGQREEQTQDRSPAPGARHACRLLAQAWEDAERDDSVPWLLAGYYHSAILARLPSAAKGRELQTAQVTAWLQEFLALEQRCDSARLPGVMKNFLRAGAWLGACADHTLAREFLDRYP